MSKIKSVKLKTNFWFYKKGKVFSFAEFQEALDSYCSNAPEPIQVDQESTESYLLESPEDFEITYEKPQILKRPDGSLISEPGNEYILSVRDGDVRGAYHIYNSVHDRVDLQRGYLFLESDKALAFLKAKMLTKRLEIQYEIDRLNAEEGWVAKWRDDGSSADDNWYLLFKNNEIQKSTEYCRCNLQYMSQKTAETILAKYSQDELKQYLEIII